MPIQCAWCRRMKTIDGKWLVVGAEIIPDASHGMCPDCKNKMNEELKKRKKGKQNGS